MKRSIHQAVYKYLPEMWISERSDSGNPVTARVTNWNYMNMAGIYNNFIEDEIKRQIKLFESRGGDISSFNVGPQSSFSIVELANREGIPDIKAELSPLVFYCSSCHRVLRDYFAGNVDRKIWKCPHCGKSVNQLQMVYTCECGYAQEIEIPYVKGVKDFTYRPNDEQYKMYYNNGQKAEFKKTCPICHSFLYPDNANSGRNYKPFTLRIINLIDENAGKFYEKGELAQKTIVSKWFDYLPQTKYEKFLSNVERAFSQDEINTEARQKVEEEVRGYIKAGFVQPDKFDELVAHKLQSLASDNKYSISDCSAFCDSTFPKSNFEDHESYSAWLNHLSFKLMQYDTIRHAKQIISLDDAINRQIELEFIDDPEEIVTLNKKLGISNVQVSCDIEILNCTYGYTRRSVDPKNSQNKNCRLKLNAYSKTSDGTKNLVYGAKLITEGILFEIDQRMIIEWLLENKIISEEILPDLESKVAVKKWFVERVRSDVISTFGEIDEAEQITKHVFALLHSMSHAFLNTAGEMSGLSTNSLTEIIIVETASIFIYAQTSQGIPLGALSGMLETRYKLFLQNVLNNNKNCVFDPICTGRDKTACMACLILPEISCNHFNAELGRRFLYTLPDTEENLVGFWEM